MSYHEKSAWACMLAILLIFIPYFAIVLPHPMAFVGLFVLAVFGLVALLVGFQTLNAIFSPSIRRTGDTPALDELDRLIEFKAAKLSGFVLAFVVLAWTIAMMYLAPAVGVAEITKLEAAGQAQASNFSIPVNQAVFWLQILFAGFVTANIVYYGRIVASYRGMANG